MEAGVLSEAGVDRNTTIGTPQGGVISPLLANIYLNQLDKFWARIKDKFRSTDLIRYADDIVILCKEKINTYFGLLEKELLKMSLKMNPDKTTILDLERQSLDFLGFNVRRTNSWKTGRRYTRIAPSKKAVQSLKDKVKMMTRRGNKQQAEKVIIKVNTLIRGWKNYFSIGYQSKSLAKVNCFLECRLRKFLRKRRNKTKYGWKEYNKAYLHKQLGLYQL